MRILMLTFIFCCLVIVGSAQSLGLSTDKTTSLVFPFPVKHADAGTSSVLIQPVKEAENVLLVKAAERDFSETNLSVFTADGGVYSFRVLYDADPRVWIYRLPVMTNASVSMYANSLLDNVRTFRGVRDRKWDVAVEVVGIYVKGETMYYQLRLSNESPIDYDVDVLRFFIRDKKKAKRTASQENELRPIYVAGKTMLIKGYSTNMVVVALEKVTIPDAKFLGVQMMERNGGRHLSMRIQNKHLLKARVLPDVK